MNTYIHNVGYILLTIYYNEATTSSVSVSAQFYSNPFWILHDLSLVTFRLVNDSITCTEVVQVPKSSN